HLLLHRSGLSPHTPCQSPGALTRVTACTLALSPIRDTLIEGFSHFVASMLLRLLPAGAVAGWDLHPLESAAFSRRTPAADIVVLLIVLSSVRNRGLETLAALPARSIIRVT